jgi:hypothetical protein
VLVLTDVSYVSYWNSFYTDAAALFLRLVAASGVRMAAAPPANTMLFGAAVLLLATSKLQHAAPGLVFCAYLAWAGRRAAAWILAGAGVAAMLGLAVTSPVFYREKRCST